jgi:hypothetical protein
METLTIRIQEDNLKKLNKLSKELRISRGKTVEKLTDNFYKFREADTE